MPFDTDEEFWKAMCASRRDQGDTGLLGRTNPMGRGIGEIPQPWISGPEIRFRCRNDHVGTCPRIALMVLENGDTGDATCPSCHQIAFITYPDDHSGPFRLFEALHSRFANLELGPDDVDYYKAEKYDKDKNDIPF